MRIKPSERVVYQNNPIVEVVCQIRFPLLLSLEEVGPAAFQQNFANKHYPLLDIQHDQQISITIGADQELAAPGQPIATNKTYHFDNEDRSWRVSIGNSFFALTCLKYSAWNEFESRFFDALNAFVDCYPLEVVQRVGLRYKDVIDRVALGLETTPWTELLAPFIVGILSAEDFAEDDSVPEADVDSIFCQSVLKLDDCNLLLQSALLRDVASSKTAFLIDGDYYVERLEHFNIDTLKQELNKLHGSAGALFRRCIKGPLHQALQPLQQTP